MLRIVSINANGLRDNCKRKELFLYTKYVNADIVMLQETHSCKTDENIWKNEYGCKRIAFSHGETNARGVAILFNPKMNVKIERMNCDNGGRYIIADVRLNNEFQIKLVNVYAPNEDCPQFFLKLFKEMSEFQHADMVVAGDFNLAFDKKLDTKNRNKNNDKALEIVKAYMQEAQMVDIWRQQHQDVKRFTHFQRKVASTEQVFARLDHMLINYSLVANVVKTDILPAYKSDHSIVVLDMITDHRSKKGKGFWKINMSIFDNSENIKEVNKCIESSKEEVRNARPKMIWEYVKQKCVKKCQEISKLRAKAMNKDFKEIHAKLMTLMNKQQNCEINVEKEIISEQIKCEEAKLNVHMEYKACGARLRSKRLWYQSGELGTKYFLGLEKTRCSNKTLRALLCEDNTITRDQAKILKEQEKFYKKLYSKNPEVQFMLNDIDGRKLTAEQKDDMDQPFCFEEFHAALKGMSNEKSPGNDGLVCEFYKLFWTLIGKMVWEAVLDAYKDGRLYKSARRGIISLIPKKSDPLQLKGWRPLTLLNVDCKLVTKMIANRFKMVLSDIIGYQQTGYIPGRFIGSNLRKMIDMLIYMEKEEIPGVLITLDFHKCFDSIEHDALIGSLKILNFGTYITSWISFIYKDFELCVTNNGNHTEYFKQFRGVHQGCALSGPIFNCNAEILARKIQMNQKIKNIKIDGVAEVVSQYADDTTVLTVHEMESVQEVINELEDFYLNTGLKVNYDKSIIYKVGSARKDKTIVSLSKKFKWENQQVEVLGILVNLDDLNDSENRNYRTVLQKAAETTSQWYNRSLSLQGKITMLNALIASLFIYI